MSIELENLSIGVDVGGTKVLGGVVDINGKILKTFRKDTPKQGGAALTQTIADVVIELTREYKTNCVGISAAGFVSADRKTMLATPNISGWNGIDLEHEISSRVNLPVVIENDANAAAWGEARFGAGRGENQLMMLTVGTGVGGVVVVVSPGRTPFLVAIVAVVVVAATVFHVRGLVVTSSTHCCSLRSISL